jgi:hypothetical protein
MRLNEAVLRAKLESAARDDSERSRPSRKRCFGWIASAWDGPAELRVGDESFRVLFCRSPLAVREAMDELVREERSEGQRLVVVTDCDDRELGDDVQARVYRNRFQRVDPWQTLLEVFGAKRLGPGVPREGWLCEELLAMTDGERPRLVAGNVLDLELVREAVLRRLGLSSGRPDLGELLQWALGPEARRYLMRPTEQRQVLREWLSEVAGPSAGLILDCVEQERGADALPLGLVLRVLIAPEGRDELAAQKALVRAEGIVKRRELQVRELELWASAAEAELAAMLGAGRSRECQPLLDAADRILVELGAESLARRSTCLEAGLRQREEDFAAALGTALESGSAELNPLALAAAAIRGHALAAQRRGAALPSAVDMAVRLMRWLNRTLTDAAARAAGFEDLALAHARDTSFVDWARESITLGYPEPSLQPVLRALWTRVTERRERENEVFAKACAEWLRGAESSERVVLLEDVIERVVAPLVEKRKVLLLVLDGLSLSIFHQLAAGFEPMGWMEIGPMAQGGGGERRIGVALLPTITEVSRASLLAGRVLRGGQDVERDGFTSHPRLRARGAKAPVLLHKDVLDGARVGLTSEAMAAVMSEAKVVGVVLNAIDDWLAKGDQDAAPWSLERIRSLLALLDAAGRSERLLVLTSDHGHVREHDTRFVAGDEGTRHRSPLASGPARAESGEVLVTGRRVLSGGSGLVVPWTESLRYTSAKQNGYHGGITPQELLVPLAIFARASEDEVPEGWAQTMPQEPDWWRGEAALMPIAPVMVRGPKGRKKGTAGALFPNVAGELKASWIDDLFQSELFAAQRELARRSDPGDDAMRRILEAFAARGDAITLDALAAALQMPPLRVQGMLTAVRRVLNVDGVEAVELDLVSRTARLNWEILRKQFDLKDGGGR